MALVRRALKLLGFAFGSLLYVWYEAVRATPEIKRRKAEKRRAR